MHLLSFKLYSKLKFLSIRSYIIMPRRFMIKGRDTRKPPRNQKLTFRHIQNGTMLKKFAITTPAVTGAAGTGGTVLTTASVTSSGNWASIQSALGTVGVRVRACKLTYLPYFGSSAANGSGAGLAAVFNQDSAPAAPTSFAAIIANFDDYIKIRVSAPFSLTWTMNETNDADYQLLSAGVTIRGGFSVWFQGGPATQTIGLFLQEFIVEFERS
jgi:hypothetical protein